MKKHLKDILATAAFVALLCISAYAGFNRGWEGALKKQDQHHKLVKSDTGYFLFIAQANGDPAAYMLQRIVDPEEEIRSQSRSQKVAAR